MNDFEHVGGASSRQVLKEFGSLLDLESQIVKVRAQLVKLLREQKRLHRSSPPRASSGIRPLQARRFRAKELERQIPVLEATLKSLQDQKKDFFGQQVN